MAEPDADVEMPVPFGIDADTGRPLPEIDAETLRSFSDEDGDAEPERASLAVKADPGHEHFGVIGDVDANNLAESGWA